MGGNGNKGLIEPDFNPAVCVCLLYVFKECVLVLVPGGSSKGK